MAFAGHEFVLPALVHMHNGMSISGLTDAYRTIYPAETYRHELFILCVDLNVDFRDLEFPDLIHPTMTSTRSYYYDMVVPQITRSAEGVYEFGEGGERFGSFDALIAAHPELHPDRLFCIPKEGVFSYTGSVAFFEQRPPWRMCGDKFYLDDEALLRDDSEFSYFLNSDQEDEVKRKFSEFAWDSISFSAELIKQNLKQYLHRRIPVQNWSLYVPYICLKHPELIPERVRAITAFYMCKFARSRQETYKELVEFSARQRKFGPEQLIALEQEAIQQAYGDRPMQAFEPELVKLPEERWETPFG